MQDQLPTKFYSVYTRMTSVWPWNVQIDSWLLLARGKPKRFEYMHVSRFPSLLGVSTLKNTCQSRRSQGLLTDSEPGQRAKGAVSVCNGPNEQRG